MKKRIYPDAPTIAFAVRVQHNHGAKVKELAGRLGVTEPEARRLIVDAGLLALQAA